MNTQKQHPGVVKDFFYTKNDRRPPYAHALSIAKKGGLV